MKWLADLTTQEITGQSYNYWGQFVNMLMTLGILLILIFVSVYVLKRLMRSRLQHLNKSTGIKILERRAIHSKASLYLIDVLGKGIVISESAGGIHVVTEFPEGFKIEERLDEIVEELPSFRETFAKKLKKVIAKDA